MTSQAPADFDSLLDDTAPLLGHLVLYSVFEGQVTPADCENWFRELGLDAKFLPGEIRPVDVYERLTGPAGVKAVYPIGEPQTKAQRRRDGAVAILTDPGGPVLGFVAWVFRRMYGPTNGFDERSEMSVGICGLGTHGVSHGEWGFLDHDRAPWIDLPGDAKVFDVI